MFVVTGKEKLFSCEQWKVRMEIKQRLLLRGRDQTLEHSSVLAGPTLSSPQLLTTKRLNPPVPLGQQSHVTRSNSEPGVEVTHDSSVRRIKGALKARAQGLQELHSGC